MADDVFPAEPVARRRAPAGRALAVTVTALVLAVLLGADGLEQTARRQPFGWRRDAALAVMRPIRTASHLTGLNLPRKVLVALSGQDEGGGASSSALDTRTVRTVPITGPPPPTAAPSPVGPGPTTAPSTTTTAPTTTTVPARAMRTPTPANPLRIWVGGDSLSGAVADALGRVLAGKPATVAKDVRVGTGLARPDVFDWFTELPKLLDKAEAEVVVLTFGGNDDQALQVPGHAWSPGTDEWRAEYQRRVALLLSRIVRPDRTIIWVGMPPVTKASLEAVRPAMDLVAKAESDARIGRGVRYFDPSPILTPGGRYRQYDGATKLREDDGVHLAPAGADRVAPFLLQLFAPEHRLPV